jgi:hypothetical protein
LDPGEDLCVRPLLLCLAILLALSTAAYAEQGDATAAEPGLDLSFDPAVAAVQDDTPVAIQATAPASPGHDLEEPFSVGVKIKTRPDLRNPAARAASDSDEPPTLADKVEGIVERSAIGVTGTYRF